MQGLTPWVYFICSCFFFITFLRLDWAPAGCRLLGFTVFSFVLSCMWFATTIHIRDITMGLSSSFDTSVRLGWHRAFPGRADVDDSASNYIWGLPGLMYADLSRFPEVARCFFWVPPLC